MLPDEKALNGRTATDVDACIGCGDLGDGGLDDRASSGERDDVRVARNELRVDVAHRLVAQRDGVQSGDRGRKLLLGDLAETGQQVEQLAELRDAAARPLVPGEARVGGDGVGVALDDRDVVAIGGEEQAREETAEPGSDDGDVSHANRPRSWPTVGRGSLDLSCSRGRSVTLDGGRHDRAANEQ